jgi:hypothetical protein
MSLRAADHYFEKQTEPVRSYLLFLRSHLLNMNEHMTEAWKYGMPFYCLKGKMICYLWVHKKFGQPYLGIVEGTKINHPQLIQEKRARMKIMLFDAEKDIPVQTINSIMKKVFALYKDL